MHPYVSPSPNDLLHLCTTRNFSMHPYVSPLLFSSFLDFEIIMRYASQMFCIQISLRNYFASKCSVEQKYAIKSVAKIRNALKSFSILFQITQKKIREYAKHHTHQRTSNHDTSVPRHSIVLLNRMPMSYSLFDMHNDTQHH
jgi:hypothetical protein